MSGFMRRFVAFLLGVAVGAVALFGGVTSGALWAFRNASPLELVGGSSETEEGGLGDLSTEDLLKILNAANDSSGYSLKRLSKQFGLDLRSMLTDMGIDVTGVDDEDLEAISELNVFALLSSDGEGLDRLLSSIKFRSFYVLMPALTGKNVGEILSVEAQEKLGDYYLSDLFEVGDDGHTRFLSLVKDLPVGSVFPSVFEAVYDEARHSYSYVNRNPRADGKPSLADIMGDVPIGALFNVVEGNSIAKELIEGKLKVVSKLPIQKILSSLASNVGIEEVSVFLENLAATVGSDVTLLDVFVENEDGGYSLSYDEILRNLNLGYMFGYYTDGEGNWYKDEAMTEPVDGLLGVIAKIDVGELYSGGESIKMVEAVFGNVTLYNLFKTFAGEEDTVPFIVNALGDMTLSDIIAEGQENIVGRLVENLDLYIGDIAIADLIDDLLSDEAKATIEDSALLSALVNVDVGALLKKEYTEEVIVQIIKNIFGDLSIADIVGDLNPDFETGALLGKLFEITVSDIIDQFNGGTALQDRLSDVTLEDVFKEFDPEWEAGPITEKIADITLSEIIYALQGDSADLEDRIYDITIGDLVNEINPDFESTALLDKVFEISFEDIVDAIYGDGDAIEQKFGDITLAEIAKEFNPDWEANDIITDIFESVTVSDVLAVLRGEEDAVILLGDLTLGDIFGMVFDYELNDDGVWSKDDKVVTYGFNEFLTARVADVIDGVFGDGDYSIKQEIKNLTVGDVVYNLLEAADMNDELVYEDGVVSTDGNLKNLSSVIFQLGIGDVLENATDVDWWLDVAGDLLVGDFAAFFFNGMTSGSATYDDGWVVSYNKLEELLNNAFNARVGDVISAVKDRDKLFFEDILGETTLGELADVIYTDWRQYSSLETLLDVPAVDVIELALGNKTIFEVYGDATFGDFLADFIDIEDEDLYMKEFFKAIYDITLSVFEDGLKNGAKEIAKNLLIGDVLADPVATAAEYIGRVQTAEKVDGEYVVTGIMKVAFEKLFNLNIYDTYATAKNDGVKAVLSEFLVGDLSADIIGKVLRTVGYEDLIEIDYVGGEYVVDGYMENIVSAVLNLDVAEAFDTFTSLSGIKGFLSDFKVGEVLAPLARKAASYIGYFSHDFTVDGEGNYVVDGFFKVVSESIYNMYIDEAYDTFTSVSSIKSFIAGFKVGDFATDIAELVADRVGFTHAVSYDASTKTYSVDGWFEVLGDYFYNLTLSEVKNKGKAVFNLYIGDYLADLTKVVKRVAPSVYNGSVSKNAGGVYVATGDMAQILNLFVNEKLFDLANEIRDNGLEYLLGDEMLGGLYVGNLFGYYYDEIDGVWYTDADMAELVDLGTGTKKAIIEKVYCMTVAELLEMDFDAILGDLYIGELLGYNFNEIDGKWYENYDGGVYSGEVSGVSAVLAGVTVNELTSDFDGVMDDVIDEVIETYTLEDIMTIADGSILSLLAGKKISELGDAVDELYVGQVMGYAKYDAVTGEELDDYADAGVWKKGGAVADELIGVLADYKISMFGEDGFTTTLTNDIFANVSVGTFFDTSAPGFMSLVDPEWKLNELEDGLNASIQTAVIEQLIDFGAFGDYYAITDGRTASSTETDSYVDTDELFVLIGSTTAAEAREYWLNLTMSEYMSSLMTYMVSIKDFFTANPAIAAQYAAWVANP